MKNMSSQLNTQFFESEETLMKILKTYEYDFGFYDVLSSKSLKVFSDAPRFLQEKNSEKFIDKVENAQNNLEKENTFSFEKNRFLSVEKLHLPLRITHCLIENNLLTVGDLLDYSPKELQNFCGIGNFSLSLIQKKLKKMGFFLKNESPFH
jgi:DNA-directed RNA polymerase alpha subunit